MSEAPARGDKQAAHEILVHGACVAIGGQGALIRGPSGAGKSDLAFRFAQSGPRNALVADDRVLLDASGALVMARPHPALAGMIELRGVGIVHVPYCAEARVRLIVDLVAATEVPRMPPDPPVRVAIGGANLPMLRLAPFEASAPLKLALAIDWAIGLASPPTG